MPSKEKKINKKDIKVEINKAILNIKNNSGFLAFNPEKENSKLIENLSFWTSLSKELESQNIKIYALQIHNQILNKSSLKNIRIFSMKHNISQLSLCNNNIDNHGLTELSLLITSTMNLELNLSSNDITKNGIKHIYNILKSKKDIKKELIIYLENNRATLFSKEYLKCFLSSLSSRSTEISSRILLQKKFIFDDLIASIFGDSNKKNIIFCSESIYKPLIFSMIELHLERFDPSILSKFYFSEEIIHYGLMQKKFQLCFNTLPNRAENKNTFKQKLTAQSPRYIEQFIFLWAAMNGHHVHFIFHEALLLPESPECANLLAQEEYDLKELKWRLGIIKRHENPLVSKNIISFWKVEKNPSGKLTKTEAPFALLKGEPDNLDREDHFFSQAFLKLNK